MNLLKTRVNREIAPKRGVREIFGSLVAFILILALIGTTACNRTGDSKEVASANSEKGTGELTIALTDAEGDFTAYAVDVESLTLTHASGAVIETVPNNTRVDFAQYTELTEFFTAATIPSGVYTAAKLKLNYANAEVFIETSNGESLPAQSIQDLDGAAVETIEVSVRLEGRNRLRIAPGVPAHLNLDFDLETSNRVEFNSQNQPIVTVEPFLIADLEPEITKTHRLRGPLKSVVTSSNEFEVFIRPFHQPIRSSDRRFGALKVQSLDETVYEINGENYSGTEGLAVLATLEPLTGVIVLGDIKFRPRRFEAREVYAGSSVPGGSLDVIRGNVIQRVGNELTVRGATLERNDSSVVFNDDVTLTIADSTTVRRQASMKDFSIADISVGQQIIAFGTLVADIDNQLHLDASNGHVRMLYTTVRGTAENIVGIPEAPLPLVINLQSIDKRSVSLYDFSGTGIDAANDADPTFYEIDTSGLNVDTIEVDTVLAVRGFVQPFGAAPADFIAKSIADVRAVRAIMAVTWSPASATAFSEISENGITLNLEAVGRFHHVSRASVLVDLTALATNTQIVEAEADVGRYEIIRDGSRTLHLSFANFAADLQSRVDAGATVRIVKSVGQYTDLNNQLAANQLAIYME